MKIYLNLLTKKANSGFTLIELILASIGMFFVVMAAGYGVLVMTKENVAASAASDTQYNLGRAVDFISEEVKTASLIRDNVSLTQLTINAPTFAALSQTGKTIVLAIRVSGLTEDIIYYTQAPASNSSWLGKLAIYRWGPPIDMNGLYTNPNPADTTKPSWQNELLVDLIAQTPQTTGCNNTSSIKIPSSSYINQGFFVCVDTNSGVPGSRKSVEIHASASALNTQPTKTTGLKSAVTDSAGNIITGSRFYDKATYEVITQAYTRASDGVLITAAGVFTESARAFLQNTSSPASNCSSSIAIGTGGSSGTPTPTSEPWSNPNTTISFTTAGILYPSINSPLSITGFTLSNANSNQITATNGSCTLLVTLRRG